MFVPLIIVEPPVESAFPRGVCVDHRGVCVLGFKCRSGAAALRTRETEQTKAAAAPTTAGG